MVKKKSNSFLSCDGKTSVHVVMWCPDETEYDKPVAVLQICHGMIEYIDRYDGFARYMAERGFVVVGNDHLGHGKSVCTDDDLGFFKEKNPGEALAKDAHHLTVLIRKMYPGIPYYLAGHSMEMIRAVFVTHDHADHIKAVGGLGEKQNIPIYTTARIHEGINRSYCMTEKLYSSVRYLEKQQPMQLEDFHIESFEVPHDGTDNVGYCIEIDGKVFAFLTDLGEITPTAAEYIRKANYLILEANYDEEMLRMGTYPQYLKERITSRTGHMSNIATAEFLSENMTEHLQYIWLCHLSKDNNHPELAYKTVEWKLREKGIIVGKDVQLCALKRTTPSDLYEFE